MYEPFPFWRPKKYEYIGSGSTELPRYIPPSSIKGESRPWWQANTILKGKWPNVITKKYELSQIFLGGGHHQRTGGFSNLVDGGQIITMFTRKYRTWLCSFTFAINQIIHNWRWGRRHYPHASLSLRIPKGGRCGSVLSDKIMLKQYWSWGRER